MNKRPSFVDPNVWAKKVRDAQPAQAIYALTSILDSQGVHNLIISLLLEAREGLFTDIIPDFENMPGIPEDLKTKSIQILEHLEAARQSVKETEDLMDRYMVGPEDLN